MNPDLGRLAHGNVNEKTNGNRGWIMGHFIDTASPFHNDQFEIKWSHFNPGETKSSPKANTVAKTICILVSGNFKVDFPDDATSIHLNREGDYVFFNNTVTHTWQALEKSLVITIRWPSLPNDQP